MIKITVAQPYTAEENLLSKPVILKNKKNLTNVKKQVCEKCKIPKQKLFLMYTEIPTVNSVH